MMRIARITLGLLCLAAWLPAAAQDAGAECRRQVAVEDQACHSRAKDNAAKRECKARSSAAHKACPAAKGKAPSDSVAECKQQAAAEAQACESKAGAGAARKDCLAKRVAADKACVAAAGKGGAKAPPPK